MLLVWVLFLCACENELEIGADIRPSEELTEVKMAEIALPAVQFFVDSINTTRSGRLLIGEIEDEIFGRINTTPFFQLVLQGSNFVFDETPEFISLSLMLKPNYFIGNESSPTNVRVFQTEERIGDTTMYFSNDRMNLGREIGEGSFTVNPTRLLAVEIPLDSLFGEELLNMAVSGESAIVNAANFKEFFKGMSVVTESAGSVAGFAMGDSSKMVLKYKIPSEEDPRQINFRVDNITHFNNIERTGGKLPVEIAPKVDFSIEEDIIIMSAGIGVVPKVSLENVYTFLAGLDTAEILRADITITNFTDADQFDQIRRPGTLTMPFTNPQNETSLGQGGQVRSVQREGASSQLRTETPAFIEYSSNSAYIGQITSFVQAIKNGLIDSEDVEYLMLRPDGSVFQNSISRFAVHNSNIKLVIVYSTLKE